MFFGFGSYFLGELFGLSGFIVIFSFSFYFNTNTKPLVHKKAQIGLVSVVKTCGFIFENFCFIYLGIITFDILFKNLRFLQIFISFCIVISLCLIRWVSVSLPYVIGK